MQYNIKIDFCEQHTNQVGKKNILTSLKGGSKYSSVSRYQNMNEIVRMLQSLKLKSSEGSLSSAKV